MFILLNGSFGIGKTTIAAILAKELPDAAIYDPERVGYVLRRLPAFALGLARQPDDYQDLALWRNLIANGARRRHRRASIVIIPMAFSNRAYFETLARALSADAPVQRICLVAPLEVVRARLKRRAQAQGMDVDEWAIRRSAECVVAHQNEDFGHRVDAIGSPDEIVKRIRDVVVV